MYFSTLARSRSAETDAKAQSEILGYSRAQGLFAGATLEGASIRNDDDENEAIYGKEADLKTILQGGLKPVVQLPAEIRQWQDTLARLAARR